MENKLKQQLHSDLQRMNECADQEDIERNHTNYGSATAKAEMLRELGHDIDLYVYGKGKFLVCDSLKYNKEIIVFYDSHSRTQKLEFHDLRTLCIKNNWFTGGSNDQYAKLFERQREGSTKDELAEIIWICSDASKQEILEKLTEAEKELNLGIKDYHQENSEEHEHENKMPFDSSRITMLDSMGVLELNALVYATMKEEQEQYQAWLLAQPPMEILNHTYEYTIREDILMSMEDCSLSEKHARALLNSPDIISEVYSSFEKLETDHMDLIRDSIERRAFMRASAIENELERIDTDYDADYDIEDNEDYEFDL